MTVIHTEPIEVNDDNVPDTLSSHNCQDFADAARQEYERLGGRTRK